MLYFCAQCGYDVKKSGGMYRLNAVKEQILIRRAKMTKGRLITFIGIVSVAVILAVSLPLTLTKAETEHDHPGKMGKMDMKKNMKKHSEGRVLTLEKIHTKHLPMISGSIEKAIKAIEAGNKKTALAELHKAQKMLTAIKKGIAKHVKPKFVNSKCPIWGSPIEPDKVTKDLIREYKGQKVAFCCADCPPAWDKLSDTQKDAKLAKAKSEPVEEHSEHKH